jgi:2-oxoglutarate dehydrogenase E2 component (dihydrolipoamide succinyltransferase)
MSEVVFDNAPEEVLHAVIEFWHFKEGDHVDEGEDLVDLKVEDNTTFTITAPVTGVLTNRFYREEDEIEIGEVLAEIDEDTEVLDEDLDLDEFNDDDDDYDSDEVSENNEVEEEDIDDLEEGDEY